jgi:hypothetical protein
MCVPPDDARTIFAVAHDCQFPPVTLADRTIVRGEADWRQTLFGRFPPLTPHERRRLLRAFRRALLVASDHGRRRLRQWLEQRRLSPPTQLPRWVLERWLEEKVHFQGDGAAWSGTIRTIAMLPAPVQATVVAECVIAVVGGDSSAWTARLPRGERGPTRLVALSGPRDEQDMARLICHEASHVWHSLCPARRPSSRSSATRPWRPA